MTDRIIDSSIVEQRLHDLSRHGQTGETGVTRTVYSPEWCAANELLESWMLAAGMRTRWDAVGNLWGVLPGSEPGPSIVSGSHVDSQAPGGRFDGALGIVGALTAVEALNARYGQPKRTLEVVSLCEEEGSRFSGASFWGSRAILGLIAPEDLDTTLSFTGEKIGDVMREIGLVPEAVHTAIRRDIDTFIELHIEQGPILESEHLPVAIVTGITGYRHYVIELSGTSNHAGAFPMDLRVDPMAGAAEIISGVIAIAEQMGRPAVTTVGRLTVEPNYPAIIPERVTFMIDARHPNAAQRDVLYQRHEALVREVAARRGLGLTLAYNKDLGPRPCDASTVDMLDQVASDLGIPHTRLSSGAVHDTQRFSEIAKTAMIFVQSKD